MNLFHDYKFSWWQLGVFKISLLSIGVMLGAYWPDVITKNFYIFLAIAVVATGYIIYLALKQQK